MNDTRALNVNSVTKFIILNLASTESKLRANSSNQSLFVGEWEPVAALASNIINERAQKSKYRLDYLSDYWLLMKNSIPRS
jgi:hypothetical protein